MRVIFWFLIWTLTLYSADIKVTYRDGLEINFTGWWSKITKQDEHHER
jgi:hypothetical protein